MPREKPLGYVPDDDETANLIICKGPPMCDLEGDEAIANQERGCLLCREELWVNGRCVRVKERTIQ